MLGNRGGHMREFWFTLSFLIGMSLVSCTQDNRDHRDDGAAARQAGRDAYRASQQVKDGARRAAQDLDHAGKEFREGWEEAKHNDRGAHPDNRDDRERH